MSTPTIANIPTAYKAGKIYSQLPVDGSADFDVTRNSTATRVNQNGLIEEVGVDVPRLDYTDGGCPVWLLEPQGTNLFTYSEDLDNANWDKNFSGSGVAPVVTANYAISPDGTQNADRVVFDATSSGSNSDRSRIRQTLSVTDGLDYTMSVWLKSTNGTNQSIGFLMDNSQVTVFTVTSEWQRFDFTITQVGTSSISGLDLRSGVASTSDILVWGFQFEQQSYATSYIPTSGSTVTRAADAVSKSGLEDYINSSEGVLYAEVNFGQQYSVSRYFGISDGSISNRLIVGSVSSSNTLTFFLTSGSVTQANISLGGQDLSINHKIAISYSLNNVKFYVDGVQVGVDTSASMPIGLDTFQFDQGNGAAKLFAKVKDLRVYDKALTDAELQQLTQ